MVSASVCRGGVGLWVMLAFVMVAQLSRAATEMATPTQTQTEALCVSSCGKIANISHPFRRKDDPEKCGDRRYELECVDEKVTVLRLSRTAEYHVEAINYNNYTIRLVDPNIKDGDCSSIPRHFLYKFNFSDVSAYDENFDSKHRDVDLYHVTQMRDPVLQDFLPLFEHIIYMGCNSPVPVGDKVKAWNSCRVDEHTYVVAGDLQLQATGWGWKPGCHVKLIAATSGLSQLQQERVGWVPKSIADNNISYSDIDIHKALVYGFELSWLHATCEHHCGSSRPCYFNPTAQNVICYSYCSYPYAYPSTRQCGIWKRIRSYFMGQYGEQPKWPNHLYPFLFGMYTLITLHDKHYVWKKDLSFNRVMVGWWSLLSFVAARILFGVTFLVVLLIYKWQRRHLSMYVNIENFLQDNSLMPISYSYKEIKKMTKNFKVKLGQGGFGSVYKGKLRSGSHVAIKMLDASKANGQEFISEVATIGRIHHVNVVRLIGFCVEGSRRALVYDFMPNGSLDKYIFSKEGNIPLSCEKIYEISLGVARGISYLHQGCDMQILHFDIKPHNILLDENFVPKVSDFGLAKLYPIDHSVVTLTDKRGTIGYIAPELFYSNIGGISYKADVYSFGMLLMEMANKRKNLNPHAENSSQIFFPTWIYDQLSKNKDIELENSVEDEKNIAKKMIVIALWCIQLKPCDRPSMKQVVHMLEGEVDSLTMPPKPLLYPNETHADNGRQNSGQTTSDDSTSYLGETSGDAVPENCLSGESGQCHS